MTECLHNGIRPASAGQRGGQSNGTNFAKFAEHRRAPQRLGGGEEQDEGEDEEDQPTPGDGVSVWVYADHATRAGQVYQGDRLSDDVFCYGDNHEQAAARARYELSVQDGVNTPDGAAMRRRARNVLGFVD
jgi:hypothetical protein